MLFIVSKFYLIKRLQPSCSLFFTIGKKRDGAKGISTKFPTPLGLGLRLLALPKTFVRTSKSAHPYAGEGLASASFSKGRNIMLNAIRKVFK